jgi:hypothetical protein
VGEKRASSIINKKGVQELTLPHASHFNDSQIYIPRESVLCLLGLQPQTQDSEMKVEQDKIKDKIDSNSGGMW